MITEDQLRLIKDFEGFYGDVEIPTNQSQLKEFIGDWKFSWQMMHDAEEVEEFVWIEGTIPLDDLERSVT